MMLKMGARMEFFNVGANGQASGRVSDRTRKIHLLYVNDQELLGRWVNAFEAFRI